MQASSSRTMRTRKNLTETNHNGHPLLSPPRTIERLRLSSTIKPNISEVNKPTQCSLCIGRDKLRRRPHVRDMKICGSLKIKSGSFCSNAPRSSHHQVGECVTFRHFTSQISHPDRGGRF
ncbi:hypothetical protein KY289_003216 [Solanum tuberosum]|nr:hypothetical protein KY289_003216 [Solanum tuberosum]